MAPLYTLSERKSRKPHSYWVIETDALTKEEKPKHISTSALSGNFYNRFFKVDNNVLVKYAVKLGIDLGEEYQKFYETGFRASQQLDGKLRDRTFDDYQSLKDAVIAKLVNGLVQDKTEARNAEIEEIATTETTRWKGKLPLEDYDRVMAMIETLKQAPFNDHKKEFLEQRLIDISQDNPNEGLKDNYFKVNPGLRADYLAVVRFGSLNGLGYDLMRGEESELQSQLAKLGLVDGRIYLQVLLFGFQKEPHKAYQHFKEMSHGVDSLTQEQSGIYLRVLRETQKAGFKFIGDSIASDAVDLFEKYGSERTNELIDKAIQIFKNTKKEADALIFLREHQRRE